MRIGLCVVLLLAVGCKTDGDDDSASNTTNPTTTGQTSAVTVSLSTSANPDFELYQALVVSVSPGSAVSVECIDDDDALDRHVLSTSEVAEAHSFDLYGLRGDRSYSCVATAGDATATAEFSTEPLPFAELPNLDMTVEQPTGEPQPGYIFYNHFPLNNATRQAVLFLDLEGDVRWYYKIEDTTFASLDVAYVGDGMMVMGGGGTTQETGRGNGLPPILVGLDGVETWRGPRSPNGQPHHHVGMLDDGSVIWLDQVDMTSGAQQWMGFGVRRMTPGAAEPSFDYSSQTGFDRGQLQGGVADPYHANSLRYVEDDDGPAYYVSLKTDNSIIRIDAVTSDITWRLGQGGEYTLLDENGIELVIPWQWWSGQHDPEVSGNRILMHDNQEKTPGVPTRVLDIEVDHVNKTASIVWQWTEPEWHEIVYGDVDRLTNGHVQVTQGRGAGADTDLRKSRIIEVDPATNEVVWRLYLGDNMSVYQSDRVDGCDVFNNAKYCDAL